MTPQKHAALAGQVGRAHLSVRRVFVQGGEDDPGPGRGPGEGLWGPPQPCGPAGHRGAFTLIEMKTLGVPLDRRASSWCRVAVPSKFRAPRPKFHLFLFIYSYPVLFFFRRLNSERVSE